jgi:hypothetical protein
MATNGDNGNTPRLKELYESELRPRLKDDLGLRSIMEVPRVQKITLNMGVGDAKTDAKALDAAIEGAVDDRGAACTDAPRAGSRWRASSSARGCRSAPA